MDINYYIIIYSALVTKNQINNMDPLKLTFTFK